MRKLLVRTATGLIENVVEMPDADVVVATALTLTNAERARLAVPQSDEVALGIANAAFEAATKTVQKLRWSPPDGCALMDDLSGASPGDSVVSGDLVKTRSSMPSRLDALMRRFLNPTDMQLTLLERDELKGLLETRLDQSDLSHSEILALLRLRR